MEQILQVLIFIILIPIYLWPVTLIVFAVFMMERVQKQQEKARKELFINFAKTKNLSYYDKLSCLPPTTAEHSLFAPKYHKIINLNILAGHIEDIEFFLVDERYKHFKETRKASACVLKRAFMDLPMFSVEKKDYKAIAVQKHFGIEVKADILDDPDFNKKIFVNGDEEKIKQYFDERVKNIFLKRVLPDYKYAAFQDCFIVYTNKRLEPFELIKMQNHSIQLLKSLLNH